MTEKIMRVNGVDLCVWDQVLPELIGHTQR